MPNPRNQMFPEMSISNEINFESRLIQWYQQSKRPLPWRETSDPYAIWLSEIILQQTRVNQGLPYYIRFTNTFPTIQHLAKANKDVVFKLWQGLGYYRRAENMLKAARVIVNEYNGVFPNNFSGLKGLPGVGDYTAAAIASIAYGEKVPVVDGNVYRVLSRIFGVKTEIGSSKAKREFGDLMVSLMESVHPGTFNEAVMEFGAMQCKPANPSCVSCIFSAQCYAFSRKAVQSFPVVKVKTKKRKLFLYYLVVQWQNQIVIRHRTKEDIWKGLYDFPSLEFDHKQEEDNLLNQFGKLDFIAHEQNPVFRFNSKAIKHQLTHVDITTYFIFVNLNKRPEFINSESLSLIPTAELSKYPVSRLVERFLDGTMFHVKSTKHDT